MQQSPVARQSGPPVETPLQQWAGFVSFFIYVLLLKGFLLPLFIIPTGSMAATLNGAHTDMTCPNCGTEYAMGVPDLGPVANTATVCPNCRWFRVATKEAPAGAPPQSTFHYPLPRKSGDRIIVHGWTYDLGLMLGSEARRWFGPNRWDVVVFKVPSDGQQNYIKRLLGLPGEKIEIIDGDLFVNDVIATKPAPIQETLWIPVYNHDHTPRAEVRANNQSFRPRFVRADAQATDSNAAQSAGWSDVDSRVLKFNGVTAPRGTIQFVNTANSEGPIALVDNFYGYNDPRVGEVQQMQSDRVTDLRIAADVHLQGGDGYVELFLSQRDDLFTARLHSDGRVVLSHARKVGAVEVWAEGKVDLSPARAARLALGNADYRVTVTVDGKEVLSSDPKQYACTPDQAKRHYDYKPFPLVGLAAERVNAEFAHVRIDRDVYYTNIFGDMRGERGGQKSKFNGGCNNPIVLRNDEFYVCGDNSPNSGDSRYWQRNQLGPHLVDRAARGEYQAGTVPADQLIGPAFLVYWPGFYPILPPGYDPRVGPVSLSNLLPDTGRLRWIR